ncbi:hypothetical protein AB0M10_15475 [Streptomyces sp. NPDC051840]|uniref:hypothetical protein n=1 Tax=Streptomyces sp. NPDC051840 TaxID=3154752 RepID=UPI00343666A2
MSIHTSPTAGDAGAVTPTVIGVGICAGGSFAVPSRPATPFAAPTDDVTTTFPPDAGTV